ncbi:nickel/cobalt ABC transporter permease [Actinobacillus vicugnae]|uniref:nickel/cobalt ABC transporter permease n=1 Tax=Actinobacillus vicugnae TaxID=2573093 RepID=UPI00124191C3|nr:nickel/cobalt ABC transporter permease [Actinobacillus vicugnae]
MILHRVLVMPLVILLITFVAFCLLHLAPSDPTIVALRVHDIELTPEVIALTRTELGLDKPFLYRYWLWLWRILHLDFGHSFITHQPVLDELAHALPTTLYLAFGALLLIIIVAVGLSCLSMFVLHSWGDKLMRGVLFFFTAMPNYWLALLLIWSFAVQLKWFPVSGLQQTSGLILPAITLALGYIGTYFRLMQGTMIQQLKQPYAQYIKARGLSYKRLIFRHILPNSLHNLFTGMGMSIPKLLAGAVVIENIFALNGIGRLCIQAIFSRDYPVIQGYILLMALLFLSFNFLNDVLQQWLDPRLRGAK